MLCGWKSMGGGTSGADLAAGDGGICPVVSNDTYRQVTRTVHLMFPVFQKGRFRADTLALTCAKGFTNHVVQVHARMVRSRLNTSQGATHRQAERRSGSESCYGGRARPICSTLPSR